MEIKNLNRNLLRDKKGKLDRKAFIGIGIAVAVVLGTIFVFSGGGGEFFGVIFGLAAAVPVVLLTYFVLARTGQLPRQYGSIRIASSDDEAESDD